jgi:hypothetical protein
MPSNDSILDQTLKCLWAHCHPEWGDQVPLDVFNRLLAKGVRPSGWTQYTHLDIQPEQISSRRERWTVEALAKLPRGHTSKAGHDFACPIIVAEYPGKQLLLDGNHRINRWIDLGDSGEHEVNIHTIRGTGHFVERPPM